MKIQHIDIIEAVIPFDDGGSGEGITPGRWGAFESVLVRIETDSGLVGWGDCFSYVCRSAVAEAARSMVRPLLLGRELPPTPEALTLELQRRLHLFGRYGIAMFAISGFDIALWDLAARGRGLPLHALLGTARRSHVLTYASLVRYGDAALVAKYCTQAREEGYRSVKLHEIEPHIVRAAREALGPGIGLSVDVNCAWTEEEARAQIPLLREVSGAWLEEPVFPPEDIEAQAALNREFPVGAGENACTRHEFNRMIKAGAVTFPQPSVIKVGGITEFMAIAHEASQHALTVMPHSPYLGPGYFATLHLAAVLEREPLLEYLYVRGEADLAAGGTPAPQRGTLAVPTGPGHGFTPDMAVLDRYRL